MTAPRAPHHGRAPRRDAALNRESILDAARALLGHDPAASLEAIAAEAGLSRRSVYGHFASRDALLEELTVRGTERVLTAVAAVDDEDPVVRIALIAAAAWDDIEHVRAMTLATVRSPRAALVDDRLGPLRARLVETIEEGRDAGSIRADVAPERLARLLVAVVLDVFTESATSPLDRDAGRELVVAMTLSTIGLSAREAAEVVARRPELTAPRPHVDPLWPPTEAIQVVRS
ncbi:TetR/AcrR family transcriptional regulator [Homoserinibacter sp. YIM 151385]|uniref:TetR/AcrR family transcriptional regulator n=1 Tax=Homoserinibacter sp. YIM 151385 TaxID=2985506 RepID=UPI0022F04BE3|nr:TetR/AcrR family transcriptional regulator [Homoserinibacter sp. YIM 151385]WBU37351.1 helix-turn-helix domain containing protein [Homoserinibacter sp. YIM 151385]